MTGAAVGRRRRWGGPDRSRAVGEGSTPTGTPCRGGWCRRRPRGRTGGGVERAHPVSDRSRRASSTGSYRCSRPYQTPAWWHRVSSCPTSAAERALSAAEEYGW